MKLSLVTNISNADLPRIQNILPRWLKVFDRHFDELIVVYDNNSMSGRISTLHNQFYTPQQIYSELEQLRSLDNRVKIIDLEMNSIKEISAVWFKKGSPFRCQTGSPIFPYIYAIHCSKNKYLLKLDSDIVFYDNGFIDEALSKLEFFDVITPPRILISSHILSTRAFFMNKDNLYNKILPIELSKMRYYQILAGIIRGKNLFDSKKFSIYDGFEDTLNKAIIGGKIKHHHIDYNFGNTLHVPSNEEADDPFILHVAESFENGKWPAAQENYAMDYKKEFWLPFL